MQALVQRRTFILVCIFSILVRVALTLTTFGTNDVLFTTAWASLVTQVGIAEGYSYSRMMNHPPLSLALMMLFERISRVAHLAYGDVFRLFQVAADGLSAFALYRIGSQVSVARARQLALFVLLSPGAAFVSAFHCNTDATMIALTMLAASFIAQPVWAGVILALAGGIKVIPVVLMPIFFFYVRPKDRVKFGIAFAMVAAVIFVPAIVIGGPVVVRNIFGYAGNLPYEWGLTGVAFAVSRNVPGAREAGQAVMALYQKYGRYFEYAAMLAVLGYVARRRPPFLCALAIMVMTILALAPGFGVQYIAWLIPVLPFALRWRGAIAVNAAISLFLFITYTVWSGGWPWWFADIARPSPYRFVAALAGYVMWAIVCVSLLIAIRSGSRRETEFPMPTEALPPSPDND
jgi:hypothetical protein